MHEVQVSVSRLADHAIGDPPANDFLQRIETDDIRSSFETKFDKLQKEVTELKAFLEQKSLPKGQYFPLKTSVAPSSVWNNSCFEIATAAAPSPTTTVSFLPCSKHVSPAAGEPPAAGEKIYITTTPSVSTMQWRMRIRLMIPRNYFKGSSMSASLGA